MTAGRVLDKRTAQHAGDAPVVAGFNIASQCQAVDRLTTLLA